MKRLAAVLILVPAVLAAQQTPTPAQQARPEEKQKPAVTKPETQSPPPKVATAQAANTTPDRPLDAVPYTPSLDVKSMDRGANPCEDFYQFSCGGWMVNNPIPADQASWSVYGKLTLENYQFLWGILEQLAKQKEGRTEAQQKIGDYFGACMAEDAIANLGPKPLQPVLKSIASLKSKSQLAAFLADQHLASTGSHFLFGFGSNQDFDDATKVIAFVGSGGLGLPDRDYYTKDDAKSVELRKKYVAHIEKMLALSGETKANAKKDAAAIMKIETALAKATLTRVERRNPYNLKHKMEFAGLVKLAPSFDWKRYFADSGVPTEGILNVDQPKFMAELEHQLTAVPLSTWKTYLRWHAVHDRAPYLSKAFVSENFDFYSRTLRGVQQEPPRWKTCVRYVDRDLGEALGQEFVRRTFSAETKQKTVEMTQQIERAMENEIRNLDWMTPETKARALDKLHAVANKVGYPERWRDYSAVNVKPNDFFGDVERAVRFESRRNLDKIGKPVDRGEWGMTPPTVNAYYNPQMNDINFPAGVLQPPLYDPKLDDAPNYGNTGSTIGHELTHAFDDEGRRYDGEGNLRDWWTEADAKAFEGRVQCVRDQYAQYTIIDDIKINSKLTSGEDVADIGGTLLAYIAWKEEVANENLQSVEGLTPDQRFFVGMAQWACENQRPENQRVNAITNPHSPGKYRINGVVTNLPQFRKAFNCAPDAPMVKEKECKIW